MSQMELERMSVVLFRSLLERRYGASCIQNPATLVV